MARTRSAFNNALKKLPNKLQDLNAFGGLEEYLPDGCRFEDDTWNTASWSTRQDRIRTLTVDFQKVRNNDVRAAIKLLILHRRRTHRINSNRPLAYLQAGETISSALGRRPLDSMNQTDVVAAERLILSTKRSQDALNRLATVVGYLGKTYNLPVSYSAPKTAMVRHGSRGTDQGRIKKRIPDQVLADLLAIQTKVDVSPPDKLFVAIIAFNIGCGFRVGELCTLPADCLIEEEGQIMVRGFPSKGGKAAPKVIPPAMARMVRTAYETILQFTEKGRENVRLWSISNEPDWRAASKDRGALLYFIEKKLHFWTKKPENRLLNPDAAWHRVRGWVDILGCLDRHGTIQAASTELSMDWGTFERLMKVQLAARNGRVLTRKKNPDHSFWYRDTRVMDKYTLFEDIGFRGGGYRFDGPDLQNILKSAIDYQLSGLCYPLPNRDKTLEERYRRKRPVLLTDSEGKTALFADEALFAMPLHFIGQYKSREDEWAVLRPDQLVHWLHGHNSRDSVFKRHGIVDETTGVTAKFTSHLLRHWLETQYHKGGMSDAQIATLMNRTSTKSNSVYNQMTNAERRQAIGKKIHDRTISGHVADVVRKADMTRSEASSYLEMQTRQINVMPHGLCLKDLATEPCPHHLSCFSADQTGLKSIGPCSHLLVDRNDDAEVKELQRLAAHARSMTEMLEDDPELDSSPQIAHFRAVQRSISAILEQPEDG